MKNEIYDIVGMHCSACSAAIERVTRKIDGVFESNVNLPLNRLIISYDEEKATPELIISKIERAGFSAQLHAEEATEPKEAKTGFSGILTSLILAGVLMIFAMGHMLPFNIYPKLLAPDITPLGYFTVQLLLTLPVLVFGRRFFIGGFKSLFHLNPNMDTLVALSASVSFVYSVFAGIFAVIGRADIHSLYFEASAMVVALVSFGKYLEGRSREKTKDAINSLARLFPDTAVLVCGDEEKTVSLDSVKVGDIILVKAGERIALDGVVIKGEGLANEAMLTGESLPKEKNIGDEVVGGSTLENGAVYVEISAIGDDTALSKIIKFVENAQGKKAPIARVADKVSGIFVPLVLAISLIAACIWIILGAELAFAVRIFASVLVVACPCAMGLATPTAIIVATGLAAKHGILIRDGEALESICKTSIAVFDKTGTVTEGKMSVCDFFAPDELRTLEYALALERMSTHPISRAICEFAQERGISDKYETLSFENIAGMGVCAELGGVRAFAGSIKLAERENADISALVDAITAFQDNGMSIVIVGAEKKALGVIAVADSIRADAADAVSNIKEMGIKTVLLTGDNKASAMHAGESLGFDEIIYEVLPTEKADKINMLKSRGEAVLMVGDGINDAPALTSADVGCAIGTGSDIAMDFAKIILMNSSLDNVTDAIRLGKQTLRNIKQNLFWAFFYNALAIPVAAGVLYPAFGILLSPMISGAAMSLSSVFVVTNALRLKNIKLRKEKRNVN